MKKIFCYLFFSSICLLSHSKNEVVLENINWDYEEITLNAQGIPVTKGIFSFDIKCNFTPNLCRVSRNTIPLEKDAKKIYWTLSRDIDNPDSLYTLQYKSDNIRMGTFFKVAAVDSNHIVYYAPEYIYSTDYLRPEDYAYVCDVLGATETNIHDKIIIEQNKISFNTFEDGEFWIYDSMGKCLISKKFNHEYEYIIPEYYPHLLLLRVATDNNIITKKIHL